MLHRADILHKFVMTWPRLFGRLYVWEALCSGAVPAQCGIILCRTIHNIGKEIYRSASVKYTF